MDGHSKKLTHLKQSIAKEDHKENNSPAEFVQPS